MAYQGTATGDYLTRTMCFDPAQDWTICGWFNTLDTPSVSRELWLAGDAINFVNPVIDLFYNFDDQFAIGFWDGVNFTEINSTQSADHWYFVSVTYDASTTTVTMYIGDGTTAAASVGTLVVDLSAFAFVEVVETIVGTPYSDENDNAAYFRVWQSCLTSAQVEAERTTLFAALETDLIADTPFLQNELDVFDGKDWTIVGSPTIVLPQSYTLSDAESATITGIEGGSVFAVVEINPDSSIWHVTYNISNDLTGDNLNILVNNDEAVTVNVLNSLRSPYSGLYYLVPHKLTDTLYDQNGDEVEVKKPNPFAETFLIRDI